MATRISTQRNLRAGAYGDPAFVPLDVWRALYGDGFDWDTGTQGTGYTHQWRTCDPGYQRFCMASVQSMAEAIDAWAMGWRTYRVDLEGVGPQAGEVTCPEQTRGISCDDCRLCGGTRKAAMNIVIDPITRGDGPATCYVNTGWLGMWRAWADGSTPAVAPESVGRYIAGLEPTSRYKTIEAWRGPSPVDGAPIVLIITGLSALPSEQSDNRKTGPMVQTYILRQDMAPVAAMMAGMDRSICGDCPLRPATVKATN
jgi:hypothetical protein